MDQSVCGLKGWSECWICQSVLGMGKDNITFSQPQPREAIQATVSSRWLGMSGCFHIWDAHYNHVSINFHFQSFLKAGRLETLFSIKNSKSQAPANSVPCVWIPDREVSCTAVRRGHGMTQKTATHTLQEEREKKCSSAHFFSLQSIKLQQQVQEPGAKMAVLPCCTQILCWSNDLSFNPVNRPCFYQYSLNFCFYQDMKN